MSDKDMKLRLIVEAKNEADAALNDLNADLRRTGKGADDLRGSMSLLSVAAKGAVAALTATVTIDAAARLVSLADAYTLAEGRLRLVTSSSTELAGVQDQLYASAQRTRTEYLSNVEGYARLAQNTKDLHLAQADLLTLNETLNKAFIISGATEAERSATMIQLSQAFSAGVLRGEEFNSVAEQGSRVLQLLADYTGRSRGELKAMAEDGQLTADILTQAILVGARDVNDEFGKLPTTVEQAGNVLKNVLSGLVNDANKGNGATAGLAGEIINLSNTVEANRDSILSLFSGIVSSATWAVGVVGDLTAETRVLAAVMEGKLDFSQYIKMTSGDEFRQWLTDSAQGVDKIRLRLAEAKKELSALGEGGDMGKRQELVIEISGLENAMRQAAELRKIQEDFNKSGLKLDDVSARAATDNIRELNTQLTEAKRAKEAYAASGLGADSDAVKKSIEEIERLEGELIKAENAKKILASAGFTFDNSGIETTTKKVKSLEDRIAETKLQVEALEKAGFAPDSSSVKEATNALRQLETHLRAVISAQNGGAKASGLEAEALAGLRKEVLPTQVAWEKYRKTVADIETAKAGGQFKNDSEYQQALGNARKALNDATGATKAHEAALAEQESAAKKAAKAGEQQQKEYQSLLDRLLPLEVAQRAYNEGLAALDKMDPTHQTERYQIALANLNREYQASADNANRYAKEAEAVQKAMAEAQRAAAESELSRQGTGIEISIAQGNLSETDALPFQVDLLEQRLRLQQDLLADMQKSTPEEISAWNSQAEAIARTTLELAEYQQRLRLQDPTESFKQGLKNYGSTTGADLLDFYSTALPEAMDASTEAVSQFFRDFAQGNLTLGESWKALGETIEDTVLDILQELLQLQLRMALLSGLGVTATGGATGGGLLGLFGAQHGGGAIGVDPPTFTRAVPLSTFMGAPRFHTGLKGNEFPAILEDGESVLTEGQMAAIGKGLSAKSQAPQVNMTIIEAPGVKAETKTTTQNNGSMKILVRMVAQELIAQTGNGGGLDPLLNARGAGRRF